MALFDSLDGTKFFANATTANQEYIRELKAELYAFLSGQYFVWGMTFGLTNKLQSFSQLDQLRAVDANDTSGRCFGYSVDWLRRELLGKHTYFDGSHAQKANKRTAKVKELHNEAQYRGLASFGHVTEATVLTDQDELDRRMDSVAQNYTRWRHEQGRPKAKGSPGFDLLKFEVLDKGCRLERITAENLQLCFDTVFQYYKVGIGTLDDDQGLMATLSHRSRRRDAWNAGQSGHAIAVAKRNGNLRFFDPKQRSIRVGGERLWLSGAGDGGHLAGRFLEVGLPGSDAGAPENRRGNSARCTARFRQDVYQTDAGSFRNVSAAITPRLIS